MRRRIACVVGALALVAGAGVLAAEESPRTILVLEEKATLTGEVVAMWCHLREGVFGTGPMNNTRGRNCIRLGSPVAIKVGKALHSIAADDSAVKDLLGHWSGYEVTVRGPKILQDGRPVLLATSVERAKPQRRAKALPAPDR